MGRVVISPPPNQLLTVKNIEPNSAALTLTYRIDFNPASYV